MNKRCTGTIDIELLILEDKIKELIEEYKQYRDPFLHEVDKVYQNVIDEVYQNVIDDLEKVLEK